MRKRLRLSFVTAFATAIALLGPASAAAIVGPLPPTYPPTGKITRAEATPDWKIGSIAAEVSWGACESPEFPEPPWDPEMPEPAPDPYFYSCSSTAFLTVGAGQGEDDCSDPGRTPWRLGVGVVLAWLGEESLFPVSADLDLPDLPLSGEPGQLACLSAIEYLPSYCPPVPEIVCAQGGGTSIHRVLDSAWLTPSLPSRQFVQGPLPQPNPPSLEVRSRQKTAAKSRKRCRRGKAAKRVRCTRVAWRKAVSRN